MAREHHEDKGRRYVAEGRLNVSHVTRSGIAASCRGSGAVYAVGWTPERGWRCSCPAKSKCAHLHALMLVTTPRVDETPGPQATHPGGGPR